VIETLNAHFVCVFTSNEDYDGATASVPKDERAELERIRHEGYDAKMSVGSVHVYLLSPDGKLRDSLHVAAAAEKDNLQQALDRMVDRYKISAGRPVVAPVPLSGILHKAPEGGALVHITARREGRGSWGEFPGENWPAFTAEEWTQFLAVPAGAKAGDRWTLDAALTRRILNHFHPQTEDCSDKDRNDLKVASLTAELQSDGSLRLSGKVTLMRAFYPGRKDLILTTASLAGFSSEGRFMLVTLDDARFGKEKFFAAAVWKKS
jgi:hypothetical protein